MKSVYDCLLVPVVTEKSMKSNGDGVYVFKVSKVATKPMVAHAVEVIFGVKVRRVNILNRSGKSKRFRGIFGKRASAKIAVVSLSGGAINFEGGF